LLLPSLRASRLSVVKPNDDLDYVNKEASESILSRIDTSLEGVYVQASNYHSLEALLKIMKTPQVNIHVSAINIGHVVHKKDVEKANAMLEKKPEYAAILAFPAKVTHEA